MGLLSGTDEDYYGGSDLGGYQFTSLFDIINQFMIAYVGEEKIISKVKRLDVQFHARRALQEFSFDTFKSTKSQEITLPPSLTMALPRDYVNYTKLSWSDGAGIKRVIYPISTTSNPLKVTQDASGTYQFTNGALDTSTTSETWTKFKAVTPAENQQYDEDYDRDLYNFNVGQRYGINPEYAQSNGVFFIDEANGIIHFSSNIAGATVILDYISDSNGTDEEMKVHKFAEEAMYTQIAYAILATRANTPEYLVARYKKDARAQKRNAKLRLSNIKLEELTQILRGKSKQIKH